MKESDLKREKNIISKLNLKNLPFNVAKDKFCSFNLEMVRHSMSVLSTEVNDPAMKWIFSSVKKYKVFLIIFEVNELGEEIYKEKISNKLPEYSYKTIAQIVDDGVKRNFFQILSSRSKKTHDLKIRNIRPSEGLIINFLNWKIELLNSLMKFK